jgi:flagellar hook-basal body complex protein FliE
LANAVQQLSQSQAAANQAIAQAMTGQGSVTQVMVALSQAEMTLNVGVGIRNGVVQAYQSIMNMPLS